MNDEINPVFEPDFWGYIEGRIDAAIKLVRNSAYIAEFDGRATAITTINMARAEVSDIRNEIIAAERGTPWNRI